MNNKAYILLAEGFEVIEALATIDVMQRGGVECIRVAIGNELNVSSSHGIVECRADILLSEIFPSSQDCHLQGDGILRMDQF